MWYGVTSPFVAQRIALPWFAEIDSVRQDALINLCFNLGMTRLLGFKNALTAMSVGDYDKAADEFMTEAMRLDTMRDAAEKGNVIIMDTAKGNAKNDNNISDVLAAMRASGPK